MDMTWAWPIAILVWTGSVALAYLLSSQFPYGILIFPQESLVVNKTKKKNVPAELLEVEKMAETLEQFEMVLVVRNDLKMNNGKIAAQCSHAALNLYKELHYGAPKALNRWERCAERQVVVKIESEKDMLLLQGLESGSSYEYDSILVERAIALKLPTHITMEAGLLRIRPNYRTVMAILGPVDAIAQITSGLKFL